MQVTPSNALRSTSENKNIDVYLRLHTVGLMKCIGKCLITLTSFLNIVTL